MILNIPIVSFEFFMKLCVIITIWTNAVYLNRDQGEIFHFLMDMSQGWPEWLKKPLIGCINCMASLHGLYITAFVMAAKGMSIGLLLQTWIPAAVLCSFLNPMLYLVYSFFDAKHYEHVKKNGNYGKQ